MAEDKKKIEKLHKEIAKLEGKITELDEEMDDLEIRLLKASGKVKKSLESKLERLDIKWESLDKRLSEAKKELSKIDPSYKFDDQPEEDSEEDENSEESEKAADSSAAVAEPVTPRSSDDDAAKAKQEAEREAKEKKEAEERKKEQERKEQEAKEKKEREEKKEKEKKEKEARKAKEKEQKKQEEKERKEKREKEKEEHKKVKALKKSTSSKKLSPDEDNIKATSPVSSVDSMDADTAEVHRSDSVDSTSSAVGTEHEKASGDKPSKARFTDSTDGESSEESSAAAGDVAVEPEHDEVVPEPKKKMSYIKTLKRSVVGSPYKEAAAKEDEKSVGFKKVQEKRSPLQTKRTHEGDDRREKRKSKLLSRISLHISITTDKNKHKKRSDVDPEQVEQQFFDFLEQIGVSNPKLRELWVEEYKTTRQKEELIKALQSNSKLASTLGSEITAQMMAQQMKNNPNIQALEKLLLNLRMASVSWLKDFQQAGGIESLFEAFGFQFFKVGQSNKSVTDARDSPQSQSNFVAEGEHIRRLELCITCIEEGVNNNAIGVNELQSHPDVLKNLFLSLDYVTLEQKSGIFELLAAICLIDPSLHQLVLDGLEYFKNVKLGVFRELLEELKEGDDLDFKVSLLSFVNAVVVICSQLAQRVRVRGMFVSEGLGEMVEDLKRDYPDQELQEQLKVFKDELDIDCKEAGISTSEEAAVDPFQVLNSLWENMQGTGLEIKFVSVLERLFKVGIPANATEIWSRIDEILQHFSHVVRTGEVDMSSATTEDVAMRILVRSQSSSPDTSKVYQAKKVNDGSLIEINPAPASAPSEGSDAPIPDESNAPPPPPAPDAPMPPPPPGGAPPPPPGGGPPPPPPPGGGPPPPPGAPRPPGLPSAPVNLNIFHDKARPKLVPWRWNALPKNQLEKSIFKGFNISKIKFDGKKIDEVFKMDNRSGSKPALNLREKKEEKEEKNPVVLDRQRCTIIEIIMKRFVEPASFIKKNIVECNLDWLTPNTIQELLSLFPLKTYESDYELFQKFTGDKATFHRAEEFIYELFTIKAVRNKLVSLNFCLEFEQKKEEVEANGEVVENAFKEVKNKRVARLLEYLLAVGNYINNSPTQCYGFKLSALLKLVDVKSRGTQNVTLLHTIMEIIQEQEPDLLEVIDEFDNVHHAADAFNSAQAAIAYIGNSSRILAGCINGLTEGEDAKMKSYFEKTLVACTEMLEKQNKLTEDYESIVEFYGEQNKKDISSFFDTWSKFVTAMRAAVKFNIAKAKKEQKLKEQAEQEKEQEKAEKTLKKFTNTLRISRKNLREIKKEAEKHDAEATSSSTQASTHSTSTSASEDASEKRARGKSSKMKKKQVNNLVEDILSSNPSIVSSGPSANVRAKSGVVQQISKGLRSSDTFSRLRGKRAAQVAKGDDGSLMDSSAAMRGSSRHYQNDVDVRSTLSKQKSTLSRADVSRFKKEQKKANSQTRKSRTRKQEEKEKKVEQEEDEEDRKSSRPSLASIQWG